MLASSQGSNADWSQELIGGGDNNEINVFPAHGFFPFGFDLSAKITDQVAGGFWINVNADFQSAVGEFLENMAALPADQASSDNRHVKTHDLNTF